MIDYIRVADDLMMHSSERLVSLTGVVGDSVLLDIFNRAWARSLTQESCAKLLREASDAAHHGTEKPSREHLAAGVMEACLRIRYHHDDPHEADVHVYAWAHHFCRAVAWKTPESYDSRTPAGKLILQKAITTAALACPVYGAAMASMYLRAAQGA